MAEAGDPRKKPSWKESYNAVRQPIRDFQAAHDKATATGAATVSVDGNEYVVTRDSAGRSVRSANETPHQKNSES